MQSGRTCTAKGTASQPPEPQHTYPHVCACLAARLWKSELYRARGVEVCAAIWKHCINKETHMPMLGGWVGGPGDRFGPLKDLAYCDVCRPSDFVLTHYQLFAEARPWTPLRLAYSLRPQPPA